MSSVPAVEPNVRLVQHTKRPDEVIASAARLCYADSTEGLLEAYANAGLPCARVGRVLPREAGVYAVRAGRRTPLPRYDTDEIARLL